MSNPENHVISYKITNRCGEKSVDTRFIPSVGECVDESYVLSAFRPINTET